MRSIGESTQRPARATTTFARAGNSAIAPKPSYGRGARGQNRGEVLCCSGWKPPGEHDQDPPGEDQQTDRDHEESQHASVFATSISTHDALIARGVSECRVRISRRAASCTAGRQHEPPAV